MSEDGFSDSSDEPNMEIQIETLMGSSIELRVSSTDTVQDIKRRIHRVEGIPVTHQNLIYDNKELQDFKRLYDVGIKDGCKIKLVLSMRGGPISTRRISMACEHQVMLKELKELLDNTREEIGERLTPGSKISVLVFKEGDIINLLRVIENEDGSYMPYSEKTISPPSSSPSSSSRTATNRAEKRAALFEKLVEDNKMMANISTLRKRMEDATARKKKTTITTTTNSSKSVGSKDDDEISDLGFKLLGRDFFNNVNLKIFEHKEENNNNSEELEGNLSESEEIALKDKHRSKQLRSSRLSPSSSRSSLYSESKGAHSHAKHIYARIHKKSRENTKMPRNELDETSQVQPSDEVIVSPLCDEKMTTTTTVSGSNRLHVARLVISDNERPKSTSESLDVDENELWTSQPRQSASYELGVLKRRPSLNYGIDESPPPNVTQELSDYNYGENTNYEVCSSSNFYHVPPFMASPSAIPPQYAPKSSEICDYYYRNRTRSPLYGRKTSKDNNNVTGTSTNSSPDELNRYTKLPDIKSDKLFGDLPGVQRLKNEPLFTNNKDAIDELCNYYGLGSAGDFLNDAKILELSKTAEEKIELPPVMKKRARCNFCNRKLNITNIYNCRCGKIFCSQHRYSEVHHCNYDYKTDGRRFLEQQNPLVTADKINRF